MHVVMIDNYDSFTYNLYQAFGSLGVKTTVIRNDKTSLREIKILTPDKIVISPGPGTPAEAGISKKVIERFAGRLPILGVCLGQQCIGEVFGARVVRAERVVHGKTSLVYHDSKTVYKNIENPFVAARYHSLLVENIPDCLEVSARTDNNVIMGIRHKHHEVEGIQFHPESFMTRRGMDIIRNFLNHETK